MDFSDFLAIDTKSGVYRRFTVFSSECLFITIAAI